MTGAPSNDEIDPALFAAYNVARLIMEGGEQISPGMRDVDKLLQGVALGLAWIYEASPECVTPSEMRGQVEHFGKSVIRMARMARKKFEETGVHPLDTLIERFPTPDGVRPS